MKKIIKEFKLSYKNMILGGLFGILRGILLVFFFLLIFHYFNEKNYNFYKSHSILISIFLTLKSFFYSF